MTARTLDADLIAARALADELAGKLYLLWEGTHDYPVVATHCDICAALTKWEASRAPNEVPTAPNLGAAALESET